jgi:hypothetical protein
MEFFPVGTLWILSVAKKERGFCENTDPPFVDGNPQLGFLVSFCCFLEQIRSSFRYRTEQKQELRPV